MKEFFNETISYYDLINGDLAPDKINTNNIAEYLISEGVHCHDMIIGKFKKENNEFQLIEEIRISSAHPLAKSYFNSEESAFPKQEKEVLKSKILEHLNIKSLKLKNNFIYKNEGSLQLVGMVIDASWDEVEENRLKYCYFNTLLLEMEKQYISNIRQINIVKSDNQLRSNIIKVQRDLSSNLNEIIIRFNLKPSDLKLKLKNDYTNKDCGVLIYKSMLVILDFISTTFYEFIDQNKNIPYHSKLLNQNDFVSKAENILEQLNKIVIEERLKLLIETELRKVLHFEISKRITYQEFDYFSRFLKSFSSFLEKLKYEKLDQVDLIHFLITISFKKQVFFEYLIYRLKATLNNLEGYEEKNEFLMEKKKEYLQLKLASFENLSADETPLVLNLLQWINLELKYSKRKLGSKKQEVQKHVSLKIVTPLSSKKLSAYYLVSKGFGVFNPESMLKFAEWINETNENESGHSYTPDSIRNNFYNLDSTSKEMLRDFAFYILDFTKPSKE